MKFEAPSQIDLIAFCEGTDYLSSYLCGQLSEAAAVSFEAHGTKNTAQLRVDNAEVQILLLPVDRKALNSHADPHSATEDGAVAIAICLARAGTDYDVVGRSRVGTGFDWYLGRSGDNDGQPLDARACLEVSGISADTPSKLAARTAQKLQQVNRGGKDLPGYVVVVGFKSATVNVRSFS